MNRAEINADVRRRKARERFAEIGDPPRPRNNHGAQVQIARAALKRLTESERDEYWRLRDQRYTTRETLYAIGRGALYEELLAEKMSGGSKHPCG